MNGTLMTAQDNAVRQQNNVLRTRYAIANNSGLQRPLKAMNTNAIAQPRYTKNQIVCFIGGVGTIKNYRPDLDTWTYAVEMEMGPEPDFGRVGPETTILLYEADIQGVMN